METPASPHRYQVTRSSDGRSVNTKRCTGAGLPVDRQVRLCDRFGWGPLTPAFRGASEKLWPLSPFFSSYPTPRFPWHRHHRATLRFVTFLWILDAGNLTDEGPSALAADKSLKTLRIEIETTR